jgi:hypothetical protein
MDGFQMYKVRPLHSFLLSCIFASPAFAASPAMPPTVPPTAPLAATAAPIEAPAAKTEMKQPSLFDDPGQAQTANLHVRFGMAPDLRTLDVLAVHPYPMKPPVIKSQPANLPEDPKDLKYLLLSTGYASRTNPDKPYQVGGWRWQFAYAEALRRSGLGVPHTLVSAYTWIDQITPYAARETKRWNDFETARFKRYKKAVEEYEKTRADVENDAVQQGLYPIELREHKGAYVAAKIPAGTWWLTCTRKKPGLTYYWQIPFTAGGGENVNITLDQANAMIITGGW